MPKYIPSPPPDRSVPIKTVVKLLRIAIGYGSRTEKIHRMLHSPDPDVAIAAHSMRIAGYLDGPNGTIVVNPK